MPEIEKIANKVVEFILTQNYEDEYELFNSFVEKEKIKLSFDDACYLVGIIRRLLKTDKKILIATNHIIKERS